MRLRCKTKERWKCVDKWRECKEYCEREGEDKGGRIKATLEEDDRFQLSRKHVYFNRKRFLQHDYKWQIQHKQHFSYPKSTVFVEQFHSP